MSDSLTQRDIDALLRGSAPQPMVAAAPSVRPYSFARPPGVARDRLGPLESVHARMALSLQSLLTSRLRIPIDVVVAGVEQVTLAEFIPSLPSPCAAWVFTLGDGVGGHGVLDLGTNLAYQMVDRLLGGPGEASDLARPLTAIEQTVVRGIAERCVAVVGEAWQDHFTMVPAVLAFESDREMLQVTRVDDTVLVAHFDVKAGSLAGSISICIPASTLEPFLAERGSPRLRGPEGRRDAVMSRPRVEAILQHASVGVSARIPAIRMSARTLADLQVGQVLTTPHPTDQEIDVFVNGRLRFNALLGQIRRKLGLQITRMHPVADAPAARGHEGRTL